MLKASAIERLVGTQPAELSCQEISSRPNFKGLDSWNQFCFESYKYTARLTSDPFPAANAFEYRESILKPTLAHGIKVINLVSVDLWNLDFRVG